MKGVFVVIGGLGDLPNRQLGGKTPLEAADTPNLDFLATRGKIGTMFPMRPGVAPKPGETILNIFGNELDVVSQGQLEAFGAGVNLGKNDLAFRVNLGSVNGEVILDRRAGRTINSSELKSISRILNAMEFPYDFEFVFTGQHRGVLVFRNLPAQLSSPDSFYLKGSTEYGDEKILSCVANERALKSREAAEIVNEFVGEAHRVLSQSEFNFRRGKKGLLPVNYLFLRAPGFKLRGLKLYNNWVSSAYSPLEKGFSDMSAMTNFTFRYPKMKGVDSYKNLWQGLKKASKNAVKIISKNLDKADYAFVYFDETSVPGLDNKPYEKKGMLEYLDSTFFKYLARIAPMKGLMVLVTGDATIPCQVKRPTSDPLPVLFYSGGPHGEKVVFDEFSSRSGKLGRIVGKDLFRKTFGSGL